MQTIQVTAYLTGNRREIHSTTPKALLINVESTELIRNHCWINLSNLIIKHQPRGHQKPIKIQFTAKLKPYMRGGEEEAFTLCNINNIKRIKQ